MKVLLRAPLLTSSGYGVHSRQVFEWLEKRGKSRALENLEEASAAIEKESLSNG